MREIEPQTNNHKPNYQTTTPAGDELPETDFNPWYPLRNKSIILLYTQNREIELTIEALHVTYYTVNMADCSSPFKRSVITTYDHSLSTVYQMHWYQIGQ